MVPFARSQRGSKTAYEVDISGVWFTAPSAPGEIAYNRAVQKLIQASPIGEKIEFESPGPLAYQQSVTVQYGAGNLVSALVRTYRYDGGAHGNHYFGSINVNPAKGVLTSEMLFADAQHERLAEACGSAIAQGHDGHVLTPAERKDMLWAEHEKAVLSAVSKLDTWAFDDAGAKVYFAPYELSAYAAGFFTCRLPNELLHSLAKEPGLLPQ
jgi:hypothetical protein